ncbi:hypothetical protein [Stenotrophomonas sp.]|uniref:hypothetical protein n=1 Tax=Stenotrophomonas sp. TaxID=69392 RepID=UPI0028A5F4ED|nr:hypothetical protein [Stenotrophomonas sp.]
MPDRPAVAARIRWADLALLMPLALLLPFALIIVMMSLQSGVACFSGDTMHCRYAAAPGEQLWYHLKGLVYGVSALLGGAAVICCAIVDATLLQRRPLLSRALTVALVIGLAVAVATVVASIGSSPDGWRDGWGRPVFILSLTLLPAIVAVRHLPRVLRAAFPRHAVSHVQ